MGKRYAALTSFLYTVDEMSWNAGMPSTYDVNPPTVLAPFKTKNSSTSTSQKSSIKVTQAKNTPIAQHSFKSPLAKRHDATKVSPKSVQKTKNTVYDKTVDINLDMNLLNKGKFTKTKDNFFKLDNGRVYTTHGDRFVPVEGPGLHSLTRIEFKVLGIYNKLGNTPRANIILDNIGGINQVTRNKVLDIIKINSNN